MCTDLHEIEQFVNADVEDEIEQFDGQQDHEDEIAQFEDCNTKILHLPSLVQQQHGHQLFMKTKLMQGHRLVQSQKQVLVSPTKISADALDSADHNVIPHSLEQFPTVSPVHLVSVAEVQTL